MITWLIILSMALVVFTIVCETIFYTEEQQTQWH
jgi:hypothetical protein